MGLDCSVIDLFPPVFVSTLTENLPAALSRSPEYSWTAAADFCGIENYEFSIGTTPGGEELEAWQAIGVVTTYRAENLSLTDGVTYFMSFRALDTFGNISEVIHSPGWQRLDPISDLPNMILRLNAEDLTSVIDGGGQNASQGGFANSVQQWLDTSGSPTNHNWFSESAGGRPTFNPAENSLEFNGTNQYLTVNNHPELNTGTVDQRNFTVAFETGLNTSTRQVVYEEGGGIRGMNVYVFGDRIYCGFYNTPDDGDGPQPFVSVSAPIDPSTRYNITWVFDYTNYTGAAGPDGNLTCYLNGANIGGTTSTSLLYAHSGALGLGAQQGDSYYETGTANGDGNFFSGSIFEVIITESVPTNDQLVIINEYLSDKWDM